MYTMGEFLDDDPSGQALINLISRGNAIIAEIMRLKNHVPPLFQLSSKEMRVDYRNVICNFAYFKISDEYERKIENNPMVLLLDKEVKESSMEVLSRFFLLFESVHKYVISMNQLVEDLQDGMYVQQTLESVFQNPEGKQLLCEMLYLYGVMLLEIDIHIDGEIRERMLVSYYRYCPQKYSESTFIDDVCKLMRSTGLGSQKPSHYPIEYFRRVPVHPDLITKVIGCLRSEDIYCQMSAYPSGDHRSSALSTQAAMLFVSLFFDESVLQKQSAKMRELVDKFFPDRWVVNVYMGNTANLIDFWESFKAAKLALYNTLDIDNIQLQASQNTAKLKKLLKQTRQLLKRGSLTEEKFLGSVNKVVILIRECNVTLKWLILHTTPSTFEIAKPCKTIRDQIIADTKLDQLEILELLLLTSQIEYNIRELVKQLLSERENKWNLWKEECVKRLLELSEAFSGEKPLTRLEKNENLQKWFMARSEEVQSLSIEKPKLCNKKIVQLLQALEEVPSFHKLSSNHQVIEYIKEARKLLLQMAHIANVKEQILVDLHIIADFSYAWNLIDHYTGLMQKGIKKDPSLAIKLRATFIKLASAMETPLLRINQAKSDDMESVGEYYSRELVLYVKKVLHIIPETMFVHMAEIVHLQTNVLKEVPMRLEKDQVKLYAQLDERYKVAELTHTVAVLAEGILKMKSTLVGIVRIDPKELLENGIRKELLRNIHKALDINLIFDGKTQLTEKLKTISDIMDGYRRSFEYIQDYIGVLGLKIWKEELSAVILESVTECVRNELANITRVENGLSAFSYESNFMSRLANEIVKITDPKITVYHEDSTSWFSGKHNYEVLSSLVFSEVSSAIGIAGLAGLDRIYCFGIAKNLKEFILLTQDVLKDKAMMDLFCSVENLLPDQTQLIDQPNKVYGSYLGKLYKLPGKLLDCILTVGQLQIIRKHILNELHLSCKFDSKRLCSCLENFNETLTNEIKGHFSDPSKLNHPSAESPLLAEISKYMDLAGIGNPFSKLYVLVSNNVEKLSIFMFLFTAYQLTKLHWEKNIGALIWKKCGEPLDGYPLIIGSQTLFRHFHPKVREQYLAYLCQYYRSMATCLQSSAYNKTEYLVALSTLQQYLQNFVNASGLPQSILFTYVPEPMFHMIEKLLNNS